MEYFEIILVYSKDADTLIKVSNAANIQVKKKVAEENFCSILNVVWKKWIEKGKVKWHENLALFMIRK